MSVETFLLLMLLGFGVGTFGTLVGAGGGFILTPVLLLLYPTDSPTTITAISLAAVFFNALSGSIAYGRQGRIDYRSGVAFAIATLPGAIAGALVISLAARRVFAGLMAVLLAAAAAWLLTTPRARKPHARASATSRTITARDGTTYRYAVRLRFGVAYSIGVGFVSSFLGIGGGIIHVPLLVRALGFPTHIATATSHFVLANTSAAATLTHVIAGSFGGVGLQRAAALSLGVIAGAQLGASLSERLRAVIIQRLLAVALLALSIRIAASAV